MKVYQHSSSGSLGKWLLAVAAFMVVMTMTFADVYGISTPGKPGNHQDPPKPTQQSQSDMRTQNNPDPSPVPEPGTMVLMGLGLGAAALMRKTKKA